MKRKKLKVRVPSKFLKKRAVVKKVNTNTAVVKKKLKVRIPSKFLKKAVKRKIKVSSKVFKKNRLALKNKKVENESPKKDNNSTTLSAVKRFVRVKRNIKVHPVLKSSK